MRVRDHVWNLRSRRSLRVVEEALSGVLARPGFYVIHFSLQGDHLHLIAEADGAKALARGMQAFSIRLAKGLNRMMARVGAVFEDRYHAHVLRTPREVRNALAYVLLNHRSHLVRAGERDVPGGLDPFSSAAAFDGWAHGAPAAMVTTVTAAPRCWLLTVGWRRYGLLSPDEVPAAGPLLAQGGTVARQRDLPKMRPSSTRTRHLESGTYS
jgi:REP element-mobilizing transposase RayT